MDEMLLEIEQGLQPVCLTGVLVPKGLLDLEFLVLVAQASIFFAHRAQVYVAAPESAQRMSGADDAALDRTQHRHGPEADQADGAAIGMHGIDRPLDLCGQPHDLYEEGRRQDNGVAVTCEEPFCRASVFGGHETTGNRRAAERAAVNLLTA